MEKQEAAIAEVVLVESNLINKKRFFEMLQGLVANRTSDFVGIGVVVYSTIKGLPAVPLGSASIAQPDLPIHGEKNVVEALAALATRNNAWHDGFHFISAESGGLTHIAQFISPPLEAALANPKAGWPDGARQMTALLISSMPQVVFSAIVSANGDVQLYENGAPLMGVD